MKERDSFNRYVFIIAFLLIVLDQSTKLYIKGFNFFGFQHIGMFYGESKKAIGEAIRITYIENPGMAFGIEFGAGKFFLSLFSVIAAIGLVYLLVKLNGYHKAIRIAFMFILAGATGNLIDRVFYGVIFNDGPLFFGKVVDFIQVDIPDIKFFGAYYTHFPVFNIADSCVTIGVCLILIFNKYLPEFSDVFLKKPINGEIEQITNENIQTESTNETP